MKNVRKIKNIILGVFLLTIITLGSQFTLAYLLDHTSPLISRFIPKEKETNDLVINTLIEHNYGINYVIPEDLEFDFQIDLGEYYANQSLITSVGTLITDENGVLDIKAKPNVYFVISDIETETKVKVKEIINKPGFSSKSEESKEITISSNEESKLDFINIYQAADITGENIMLYGKKVLEGREWKDNDSFTFKLETLDTSNKWITLSEKNVIYNKDNDSFNEFNYNDIMKNIKFSNIGTYKFRLSEVIGNLDNIDYDKTINEFEITISDKTMDGILEIDNIKVNNNIVINKNNNKFEITVTFNNKYVYKETEIEYKDKEEQSAILDESIVIKDTDYTIDTVISKFEGLDNNSTYTIYDKDGNVYNETLVRTGDYVIINHNGQEHRFDLVLNGDTSGDGAITPLDYIKIKNHIIGNTTLPGNAYELAADVSGDGEITPLDYIKIKNHIIKGGN